MNSAIIEVSDEQSDSVMEIGKRLGIANGATCKAAGKMPHRKIHAFAVTGCGLCHVWISDASLAMRVTQGGHDVPSDKLTARFPRTMANLQQAIRELPCVLVFDNDNLRTPFRLVAVFQNG